MIVTKAETADKSEVAKICLFGNELVQRSGKRFFFKKRAYWVKRDDCLNSVALLCSSKQIHSYA